MLCTAGREAEPNFGTVENLKNPCRKNCARGPAPLRLPLALLLPGCRLAHRIKYLVLHISREGTAGEDAVIGSLGGQVCRDKCFSWILDPLFRKKGRRASVPCGAGGLPPVYTWSNMCTVSEQCGGAPQHRKLRVHGTLVWRLPGKTAFFSSTRSPLTWSAFVPGPTIVRTHSL